MRSNRRKKSIWALPALAALSVSSFAGVAVAQTLIEEGTSDDLVAPPAPSCPSDAITLIEQVEFTSAGSPIEAPVLGVGSGLSTSIDIEGFDALDAGTIDIVEIITYDAHTGRALWPVQDNESVAVEFSLDGDVVAMSEFTPDVEDGVNSAWVVSSLGELELPDGADAARIVHFNQELNNDSVVVASACATFTPSVDTEVAGASAEAEDEEPEEDLTLDERIERNSATEAEAEALAAAAATAQAAADVAAEVAAEADDADAAAAEEAADEAQAEADAAAEAAAEAEAEAEAAAEAEAEAASEGADGDELASTGANEIAFAVIAFGIMMFGVAFKIQGQDPESLRPELH